MNSGTYRIEYGDTALQELDKLPAKQRVQILRKI
jgi:mRNA-degrading endonuclease RelE of RelBE toxin-antitoxin system